MMTSLRLLLRQAKASAFAGNTASDGGGAVEIVDESSDAVTKSHFIGNFDMGVGGGGLYVSSSQVELLSNTFAQNLAPSGGGGAILSSEAVLTLVNRSCGLANHTYCICGANLSGHQNAAAYGPCVATGYSSLELLGLPTLGALGKAGTQMHVTVIKRDRYGQKIVTDSDSSLRLFSAMGGR
jgi:predicted outer membrane repeat protein